MVLLPGMTWEAIEAFATNKTGNHGKPTGYLWNCIHGKNHGQDGLLSLLPHPIPGPMHLLHTHSAWPGSGTGIAKKCIGKKQTQWHIYIFIYIWYMPSHLAFMALMVVLVFMAFMAGMAFIPLTSPSWPSLVSGCSWPSRPSSWSSWAGGGP